MDENEKIARLRLIRSENVGCITFRVLLRRYKTATEAVERLPETARRGGAKKAPAVCSVFEAEKELEAHAGIGAEIVFDSDADYPPLLKHVPDAPPVLSVLGNKHLLRQRHVALVGTRNASVNGRNLARKMANDFVAAGISVVSGLALGIDAAAHEGALFSATPRASTTAVLGTGINIPYPSQNKELYFGIRHKGVLISEFPFGTAPQPSNFPRRNRIISGMAEALTVIEASMRSGSLITAKKALEQGRDVYAVPGNPLDPRASGVNHLIKNGAVLVESAADVLENISALSSFGLHEDTFDDDISSQKINISEDDLSSARQEFLKKLDMTPVSADVLARETGLPAQTISVLLVELELAGKIERLPGNKILRLSDI